jgi:carbon storage regulator
MKLKFVDPIPMESAAPLRMLAEIQHSATEASMLVLSRKRDEQLVVRLGEETVVVRVLEVARDRVRLGIIAPRSVAVHREEVARRIEEWQKELDELLTDVVPQS